METATAGVAIPDGVKIAGMAAELGSLLFNNFTPWTVNLL
jgi:hypothetical protein